MKKVHLVLLASCVAVSGCSTYQGLKTDLARGFDSLSSGFASADPDANKKSLPAFDGICPQVAVRPDLSHLAEFYDQSKPTEATKISQIDMTGVDNTCRVEGDGLVMQIDIALAGETGSKARAKPSDKPSFAYPYFVAVTDADGNVVSKEIFAASVAYDKDQNTVARTESIFQKMPFADKESGQLYNVIIGFQLSEDQLAYNQMTGNGTDSSLLSNVAPAAGEPKKPSAPAKATKKKPANS